jgi:nicotinamidase-related amidase
MTESNWIERAVPFLEAIDKWFRALPSPKWEEIISDPAKTAIACVDLTVGFSYEGNLSSPRVAAIVHPIADLFRQAYIVGVRHFLLPQDAHDENAVEFGAFAPHAVSGTKEAETVPELKELPFADLLQVFAKNSINSFIETELGDWVEEHPEVDTYIVVGDCTDLCVYQLAMHLRTAANAKGLSRRVIVPANAVDTYHVGVGTAKTLGIFPHEGDLMHYLFLHHMALNGVEVVRWLN